MMLILFLVCILLSGSWATYLNFLPHLGTFYLNWISVIGFSLQPAHERIGVVDSQWIIHQVIPSLGRQVSYLQQAIYFDHAAVSMKYQVELDSFSRFVHAHVIFVVFLCLLLCMRETVSKGIHNLGWLLVKSFVCQILPNKF